MFAESGYYRVEEDIPNPTYDRRTKYGGSSIKELKKGEHLYFVRYNDDRYGKWRRTKKPSHCISERSLPKGDWCVPTDPSDLDRVLCELSADICWLLQHLLKAKVVTFEQCKAEYDKDTE